MSTEENKALMRRIPQEVFNRGALDVVDEVMVADFVEHVPAMPGFPTGIAGIKAHAAAMREAFPDFQYTVEDEIAEGDRVMHRVTGRGTMRGALMGMPPTGKQATWTEIHIGRVAGGKIVEHWAAFDMMGMMQQLGLLPTPGQGKHE
jgi:predicted ester cyclase